MKLGTKTKQPGERKSYTINYSDALNEGDYIIGLVLKGAPPTDLTVDQLTPLHDRIRFFVDAGVDGTSYKLTFVVTTADGVRYEDEVTIKIKEA